MVFIVEDLEDFMQCARFARYILYRKIDYGSHVELRVKAGKIAWTGTFKQNDDALKKLLNELEALGAVEVADVKPDEVFMA